jgi:c-di-AMP phosphodiesterase-like protein
MIMEKLGGGGHYDAAAAEFSASTSPTKIRDMIISKIKVVNK